MRSRVATVAAMAGIAMGGLLFSPVFTVDVVVLPVCVVLGAVLITDELTRGKAAVRPLVGTVIGVVCLVVLVGLRQGTDRGPGAMAESLRLALVEGWRRVLDYTWPVRPDPPAIIFIGLVLLLASLLALEILRAHRPLAAMAPGLAVIVLAQIYSPASGWYAVGAGVLYCLLAAIVLVSSDRTDAQAHQVSLAPLAFSAVAVIAVGLAAGVVLSAGRPYSLRDHYAQPQHPAVTANPLDQISDRLLDPQRVVFTYRADAPATLWSLVVLDQFDGDQWNGPSQLRWLGARNPDGDGSVHTAQVWIADLGGQWLPTPGTAVGVNGVQPMIAPTTGTLVSDALVTGTQYQITWAAPALPSDPDSPPFVLGPESIVPPGVPSDLSDIAFSAVQPQSKGYAAAKELETFLKKNNQLATGADLPTGHSYAQLAYFLTKTHRGTSEQFATAYAVLARVLGFPARVAVGFRQPQRPGPNGNYVVRNSDVLAWPEVHLAGVGWVPMDPLPDSGSQTGPQAPPSQAPQSAPAPAGSDGPSPAASASPSASPSAIAKTGTCWTCVGWTAFGVVAMALLVPVSIPVRKRLRRMRRRRERDPRAAVVGAWHEVRDRCTDFGVPHIRACTPRDLRALFDGPEAGSVAILGSAVDQACWSREPMPAGITDQAWSAARTLLGALSRSRRRSLRAAFSLASLRYRSEER